MEPKLLVTISGEKIKTAEEWEKYRLAYERAKKSSLGEQN